MNRGRVLPGVVLAVRVILGGIFITAGIAKLGNASLFAQQIAAFRILPQPVIAPVAVALPYFELLLGGYLIVGLFTRAAGWVAATLLVAFDAAIASAVIRGMTLDCGCFGAHDTTVTTWGEVARDAVFIVLALVVALRPPGMLSLDRRIGIES